MNTYHINSGNIDGVDVSGRTISFLVHIPGNVLKGNWKVAAVVDDGASDDQMNAIMNAFGGKLGGPLADVAQLVGEVVSVERAPITFEVNEGNGTLKVGSVVDAEMAPYRGPTGVVTTLNESVFTTIPGAPSLGQQGFEVCPAGQQVRPYRPQPGGPHDPGLLPLRSVAQRP